MPALFWLFFGSCFALIFGALVWGVTRPVSEANHVTEFDHITFIAALVVFSLLCGCFIWSWSAALQVTVDDENLVRRAGRLRAKRTSLNEIVDVSIVDTPNRVFRRHSTVRITIQDGSVVTVISAMPAELVAALSA